jgi:hypothetical protein
MRQSAQEDLARKRFDCELPPEALTELVAPRRPRILGRSGPIPQRSKASLYFVLLMASIVIGGAVITLWHQGQTAERASSTKAISQPALTPTPAPTPPGSADQWKAYLTGQQQRVPRAELVKPAPRA